MRLNRLCFRLRRRWRIRRVVAASAPRLGYDAISSAFLWRAGQRRLLSAQKGSRVGGSLRRDLIADGLADRGRPRRVANLRTCSASPSGPRRLCSFGHRAVDCAQCSATTCLLVRGAGDVLRCGRWCPNGCIRPVLKHGPRSATCVRVFG